MGNTIILCVGKLKESWQRAACAEYMKRLTRYGAITLAELPDFPEPRHLSASLETQIKNKEGAAILSRLKPEDFVICLCVDGTRMDSIKLAASIACWQMSGRRRVVWVIGGSLGLSQEVERRADVRLSFSDMTFPHGLMRVILLEQMYRAARITEGGRYHK